MITGVLFYAFAAVLIVAALGVITSRNPVHAALFLVLALRGQQTRNTKTILKSLARTIFDDKFVYRPKSGFTLPLLSLYKDKRFVSLMQDRILPGIRKRGVVRADTVNRWWANVENLPRSIDEKLWISIAFELWAQQFLEIPRAQAPRLQ